MRMMCSGRKTGGDSPRPLYALSVCLRVCLCLCLVQESRVRRKAVVARGPSWSVNLCVVNFLPLKVINHFQDIYFVLLILSYCMLHRDVGGSTFVVFFFFFQKPKLTHVNSLFVTTVL